MDSRTLESNLESGNPAGFEGRKNRKGSKVHAAVDILDYLLAPPITLANKQDLAQITELVQPVQSATDQNVKIGQTRLCDSASARFVELFFGWAAHFRRLAQETSAWRRHWLNIIGLLLARACRRVYSPKVNNSLW